MCLLSFEHRAVGCIHSCSRGFGVSVGRILNFLSMDLEGSGAFFDSAVSKVGPSMDRIFEDIAVIRA